MRPQRKHLRPRTPRVPQLKDHEVESLTSPWSDWTDIGPGERVTFGYREKRLFRAHWLEFECWKGDPTDILLTSIKPDDRDEQLGVPTGLVHFLRPKILMHMSLSSTAVGEEMTFAIENRSVATKRLHVRVYRQFPHTGAR